MHIEVIVRTHNKSNIHTDRSRYINVDKTTLIVGCLSSVVNSFNLLENNTANFVILDDHSTDELFPKLHDIFSKSKFPYKIVHLEGTGFNNSALKQFEYCRDSAADLVYSLEDDYLHCPSAINEMVKSYQLFKEKTGKEIAIYPFDMPDDYKPPWMEPCYLVHGSNRHWKTGVWTTQTMLVRPEIFKIHWPIFEKLATKYNPVTHEVHEGNTILEIWRNHALRFSPVPSLALHLQFDQQVDPFINWESWWDTYTKL